MESNYKAICDLFLFCRYGLYGTPLEPFLFDIDPPHISKPTTSSSSYAAILSAGGATLGSIGVNSNAAAATGNAMVPGAAPQQTMTTQAQDEVDFKDLMSLNAPDKSKSQVSYVQRHIYGLIEVEPLHFTCHATSDGTRMERMDTCMY